MCARKGLEQHHPRPFRAHIAIRRRIKALATAIGGQQTRLAEAHLNTRMNQRLHPPRQRHLGFPPPEALAGQMHRYQR